MTSHTSGDMAETFAVLPGHALGFMTLGAALQDILSTIEKDKKRFASIDIHFSQSDPLTAPVVVTLPDKGIRLRFDGADQRLRLIEVIDFTKIVLTYNGQKLAQTPSPSAPVFKPVYRILSPSFPGEYLPPAEGSSKGIYILSWPGIAWNFPVKHSAWTPKAEDDYVGLLESHATSPARHMAIFEGKTWADARKDLFVREPSGPRSTALATRPHDNLPAEIEAATVHPGGRVELERRPPVAPFTIILNETTPQDLISELGAPDATFKPSGARDPTPEQPRRRTSSMTRPRSNGRVQPISQPSSYSSTNTDTFETDFDSEDAEEDPAERRSRDAFWCYFGHGMDILVGPPTDAESTASPYGACPARSDLVVKRVVIQGNIPGSAAFNRHRRLRWTLILPSTTEVDELLTSESDFEQSLKPALLATFTEAARDPQTAMGRVINRCWDDPMGESSFFLPDQDRTLGDNEGSDGKWLGNVRLFRFPGLGFEVVRSGGVASLYVTT